jgi:hypothetical protein
VKPGTMTQPLQAMCNNQNDCQSGLQ